MEINNNFGTIKEIDISSLYPILEITLPEMFKYTYQLSDPRFDPMFEKLEHYINDNLMKTIPKDRLIKLVQEKLAIKKKLKIN